MADDVPKDVDDDDDDIFVGRVDNGENGGNEQHPTNLFITSADRPRWSQWSARGFVRVFSKVFGQTEDSKTEDDDGSGSSSNRVSFGKRNEPCHNNSDDATDEEKRKPASATKRRRDILDVNRHRHHKRQPLPAVDEVMDHSQSESFADATDYIPKRQLPPNEIPNPQFDGEVIKDNEEEISEIDGFAQTLVNMHYSTECVTKLDDDSGGSKKESLTSAVEKSLPINDSLPRQQQQHARHSQFPWKPHRKAKKTAAPTKESTPLLRLTPELLESKRQQVVHAATLVSRALHAGPWPSPHRSLDPTEYAMRTVMGYKRHTRHMSMVGASVEKFALDIILPSVMQELSQTPPRSTASYSVDDDDDDAKETVGDDIRVFIGTLILLREVLILNATSIFGPSAALTGDEADFGTTLLGAKDDTTTAVHPTGVVVETTTSAAAAAALTSIFTIQVLATTIILTGLADLGEDTAAPEELAVAFLNMVESYEYVAWLDRRRELDCNAPMIRSPLYLTRLLTCVLEPSLFFFAYEKSRGSDQFADCLEEVPDSGVSVVYSNGQEMGKHEQLAWTISCNSYNREKHPLIRLQNERRFKRAHLVPNSTTRVQNTLDGIVPTPTAAHVSILQVKYKSSSVVN